MSEERTEESATTETLETTKTESEALETTAAETSAAESADSFRKGYASIAEPDSQKESTAEEEAPAPKQFTEEEVRNIVTGMLSTSEESLRKQLRDANGKIGGLFQKLEKMSTTASPAAVKLSPTALKRLKEEYPELGEVLAEDLAEIFASASTPEPKESRPETTRQQAEAPNLDVLTELHPDWQELRDENPPDYQEWIASLKPTARLRYLSSTDPLHVAEKLDEFKDWRDAKQKAPPQEPEPSPAEKSRSRLEKAVTPTNGQRTPLNKGEPSPSERFRAGYNRIAGART